MGNRISSSKKNNRAPKKRIYTCVSTDTDIGVAVDAIQFICGQNYETRNCTQSQWSLALSHSTYCMTSIIKWIKMFKHKKKNKKLCKIAKDEEEKKMKANRIKNDLQYIAIGSSNGESLFIPQLQLHFHQLRYVYCIYSHYRHFIARATISFWSLNCIAFINNHFSTTQLSMNWKKGE